MFANQVECKICYDRIFYFLSVDLSDGFSGTWIELGESIYFLIQPFLN
jgi:hypothetical protein